MLIRNYSTFTFDELQQIFQTFSQFNWLFGWRTFADQLEVSAGISAKTHALDRSHIL